MKIKILTTLAGPQGVIQAGSIVLMPDRQAKELVAGKYAIEIKPPRAKEPEKEAAMAEAPEIAASIKKPGRRKKKA